MNRLQLVDELVLREGLRKEEAKLIVELFFDSMKEALAAGDRVEIRGLCSFHVKIYESYTGRNPKTGKKVIVKSKKLPFFKCGTELRNRVDCDSWNICKIEDDVKI